MAETYDFGQRTINLMNFYLKSENTEEKFEQIIEKCQNENIKYIDPDFYPQINIKKEDETLLGLHQWRRAEEFYPNLFDNIKSETICQGRIGDCYLITAMIYLAQKPELIKDIIHPKSSLKYGCILVYLYFLGQRIPIIVDTQIPFFSEESKKDPTRPIFSKPRSNDDSCWFIFIEKAFAKACGDYISIDSGTTDYAARILTDQYTENHNRFGSNNKLFNPIDQLFDKLHLLNEKKTMLGASININEILNCTFKQLRHKTGLINEHGYQIMDLKKVENKNFIKLRNPWGNYEWKGAYSNESKELTEKLKKELDYKNNKDGSFWMIEDDFIKYFTNIIISLPNEKDWKFQSVYGKIEGYLDNRAPMGKKSNTGCLPQWSIKFTKKTVVRISFDISGPSAQYGIQICKSHGKKVDQILGFNIYYQCTNTPTNGIEYEVNDFNEPYTFFLIRSESKTNEPTYFRIRVESPDIDFSIKKFNDNFINEKWNSFSYQGIFGQKDFWNVNTGHLLSTCKQWSLRFPQLKKNEKAELRIQVFKNAPKGKLELILAKSKDRIDNITNKMRCYEFLMSEVSEYDEFIAIVDNVQDDPNNDINQWIFCIYRNKEEDISQYKFVIWSQTKFECCLIPETDSFKSHGYSINGIFKSGKDDGASPLNSLNNALKLKQWCLVFKKSPTTLFVDLEHKNGVHTIFLQIREKEGEKIDATCEEAAYFHFCLSQKIARHRAIWKIENTSKPYALCVAREPSNNESNWCANILADNEFEMNEIDDDKLGKTVQKYKAENYTNIEKVIFPQIKLIEQPTDFSVKALNKFIYDKKDIVNNKNHNNGNQPNQNNATDQRDLYNDEKELKLPETQSKCCILI